MARREKTGLEAVFLASRAELLRFVSARLKSVSEGEDVLQDVWLKLSNLDPSGPVAEPLAYLYRMAENTIRDRQRSDIRRRVREANWMEDGEGPSRSGRDMLSPERIAVERDRLKRVEARISELPERTHFILRAVRLDGRKQGDIAAELGISLSAVEKHLQRAYRTVINARLEDDAESGAE